MFIVYLVIVSEFILEDKTFLDVWNESYGTVIYHWSTMITLISVHCLASCLTIQNVKVLKDEFQRQRERHLEGQNASFWTWWTWVTSGAMLTWWWAEKNDNESVQNAQDHEQQEDPNDSSDDDEDIYLDDVDDGKANKRRSSISSGTGSGTSVGGAGTSKGSYFSAGGYSEVGC